MEDQGPQFQSFTKETIIPEIVLQQHRAAERNTRQVHVNLSEEEGTLHTLYINRNPKNIDFKIFKIDVDNKQYLQTIYDYIKNISKCTQYKELIVDLNDKVELDIFNKTTLYNITFKGFDVVPTHCYNSYVSQIIPEAGGLIFSNLQIDIPIVDTMSQLIFIERKYLENENISTVIYRYGGQKYKDNCLSLDKSVNVLCINKYNMWNKSCILKV